MQANLNNYDTRASRVPPRNQPYTSKFVTSQDGRLQFVSSQNLAQTQRPPAQKPKAPEKMPKARALALANRLKRGLAIASIVGFGAFGGLVALHQVGTSSSSSTPTSSGSSSTNSSNSTNSSSSSSSSSQNSNNFLNQQGGNTSGTSSSSSNSGSTNSSSSSSSSSTVTGTHSS